MTIESIKRNIKKTKRNGELITLLEMLSVPKDASENKFMISVISELHNSDEIDIFNILNQTEELEIEYHYYTILDIFIKVLPFLSSDVESVLNCLVRVVQKGGEPKTDAFESYCRLDPEHPKKSIELILNSDDIPSYSNFISCSILASATNQVDWVVETILSLAQHCHADVRKQMYITIGEVDIGESQSYILWDLLCKRAKRETDKATRPFMLSAILRYGDKFPSYKLRIAELLKNHLIETSPDLFNQVSCIMADYISNEPQ